MSDREKPADFHSDGPHPAVVTSRLNWLRAGVLGASDGLVSIALGVAGTTNQLSPIVAACVTVVVGGATTFGIGSLLGTTGVV